MSILPPVERRGDGEEEEEETGGGSRGGGEEVGGREEGEEAALRHLFFIFSSCAFRRFSRFQGGWKLLRILPLIETGLFTYLLGYLFISHHLKKKLTGGGRRSHFRHVCDAGRLATDYYGP